MPESRLKKDSIFRYLSETDKDQFLSELLHAIDQSKREGSFDAVTSCIEDWEDTAELLSIPGLKERVWERFTKLKEAGSIS